MSNEQPVLNTCKHAVQYFYITYIGEKIAYSNTCKLGHKSFKATGRILWLLMPLLPGLSDPQQPWASYQIRKIAGCACAGNAGNVFPCRRFQGNPLISDPGMHHGTCVTHVPWCMSGSLTCGNGENVPGIPGACAPAILSIWQEAHGIALYEINWCLSSMRNDSTTCDISMRRNDLKWKYMFTFSQFSK